jgi:D-alanine-D-alanine ligase
MRVAVIYNEPRAATLNQRWLSGRSTGGSLVPADACDIAEFSVLHQVAAVTRALLAEGHEATPFGVGDGMSLAAFLASDRPDVIFNCCEGVRRNAALEMSVAALYELLAIPFTGSPARTLALSLNKAHAKAVFHASGLATPRHAVWHPRRAIAALNLEFPLIIKPLCEDASIGIDDDSVVETEQALHRRVQFIWTAFEQPALVEEFIDGRELNVAVLATSSDELVALPISEIVFGELPRRIVGYQAKWIVESPRYQATTPQCPADLPAALAHAVRAVALQAAHAIGLRDYGRIDLRVRADDDTIFVIEANPNPDIGFDSGFVRASEASGRTHAGLICEILARAAARARVSPAIETAAATS